MQFQNAENLLLALQSLKSHNWTDPLQWYGDDNIQICKDCGYRMLNGSEPFPFLKGHEEIVVEEFRNDATDEKIYVVALCDDVQTINVWCNISFEWTTDIDTLANSAPGSGLNRIRLHDQKRN